MLGAVGKGMGAKLARVKLCRVSGDVRVWESCLGVGLVGDAELEPTYRQAGLRPSVCKASEPERCATESAPLSESAEVIIWILAQINLRPHADSQAPLPFVALPLGSSVSPDPRCSAPPTDTMLHTSELLLCSEPLRTSGTGALTRRRRTPPGIRSWRKDDTRDEPTERRCLGTSMGDPLPCPSPFATPVLAMTCPHNTAG
jgi:hypothetical protein